MATRISTTIAGSLGALAICLVAQQAIAQQTIQAAVGTPAETKVDGVAVWVNASDPAKSTVLGAMPGAGLAVYGLDGTRIETISFAGGGAAEVDVRYSFPLGGAEVSLVAGGHTGSKLYAYTVDPATGQLTDVLSASAAAPQQRPYGSCMYHDTDSAKYYLFITTKTSGKIEQFELLDDGNGKVTAASVGMIQHSDPDAGDLTIEACAVDDENHRLFVAQENVSKLWSYGAKPNAYGTATLVEAAAIGASDNLEGIAIYKTTDGGGYLLASLQGSWTYKVYDRHPPHAYLDSFKLTRAGDNGPVEAHDCIEAVSAPLGASFPSGLMVTQTSVASPHYEIADWNAIAAPLGLKAGGPAVGTDGTMGSGGATGTGGGTVAPETGGSASGPGGAGPGTDTGGGTASATGGDGRNSTGGVSNPEATNSGNRAADEDDAGCSCSMHGQRAPAPWAAGLLLMAGFWGLRRRRTI